MFILFLQYMDRGENKSRRYRFSLSLYNIDTFILTIMSNFYVDSCVHEYCLLELFGTFSVGMMFTQNRIRFAIDLKVSSFLFHVFK